MAGLTVSVIAVSQVGFLAEKFDSATRAKSSLITDDYCEALYAFESFMRTHNTAESLLKLKKLPSFER